MIGGKIATKYEYKDLQGMMTNTKLSEMDSSGDYFTWSNKHTIGIIYSRIDRVLGNKEWFLANMDTILHIPPPNASDHAILYLTEKKNIQRAPHKFKFNNCIMDFEGYDDVVKKSWTKPCRGGKMKVL